MRPKWRRDAELVLLGFALGLIVLLAHMRLWPGP
jgi:hypothetical protein